METISLLNVSEDIDIFCRMLSHQKLSNIQDKNIDYMYYLFSISKCINIFFLIDEMSLSNKSSKFKKSISINDNIYNDINQRDVYHVSSGILLLT